MSCWKISGYLEEKVVEVQNYYTANGSNLGEIDDIIFRKLYRSLNVPISK